MFRSRADLLVQWMLVFVIFALFGAWPVPDVNEPHYLIKARHTWQPTFLAGDLFVDSPAAHHVFNLTFGWLTLAMSFDSAAWTGRIVVWLLQAWGWTLLNRALVRASWAPPVSAGLFVLFNESAHMAGEWVVGGLEAKGIAYALVFFALAAFVRRRWNRACMAIGAATAFHVLVGGWTAVATAAAWVAIDRRVGNFRRLVVSLLIAATFAACGVIPALLLNRDTAAHVVADAQVIYVFGTIAAPPCASIASRGLPAAILRHGDGMARHRHVDICPSTPASIARRGGCVARNCSGRFGDRSGDSVRP